MKQVKCPKCGRNYYLDNNPVCPFCGADNSDHTFAEHEIPETIEELKQWYKDRNLPDENVTRFFIGKNYTEPKAFGIYEENGEFIVYKNKANGQRAIRYQGPNEAFAVKELYVRLKEEIINQKKNNDSSSSYTTSSLNMAMFAIFVSIMLVAVLTNCLRSVISNPPTVETSKAAESNEPDKFELYRDEQGYFYKVDFRNIYTCWYVFNPDTAEWEFYEACDYKTFPANLDSTMISDSQTFEKVTGLDSIEYGFYNSNAYACYRFDHPSSSGYYIYEDKLYYYLPDCYANYYTTHPDLSGWYIFDEETADWAYCIIFDEQSYFADELKYNYDNYEVYQSEYIDYFKDNYGEDCCFSNYEFENTDYYADYQDYKADYQAWEDSIKERESDWYRNDNDRDYDWDDDDDWDSDSSDWDSDW